MTRLLQIKSKLENQEVSYSDAFEEIKKLPKPWHTKEWKESRTRLLKDSCEQCSDSNSIRVLQHFNHPPEFRDIRSSIFGPRFENFLTENQIDFSEINVLTQDVEAFKKKEITTREACPNCEKQSLKKRKTVTPLYRCSSCGHQFNEPISINYIPLLRKRLEEIDIHQILRNQKVKSAYYELRHYKFKEWEEEISREALLISIELSIDYSSLKDTVTFCKRCASNMDVANHLLCYSCKKNYFNYQIYDVCYDCWQDGKEVRNPFIEKIKLTGPTINL